jgi:5-methylthioribose kinase
MSNILNDKNFNQTLYNLHSFEPPKEILEYLDDTDSYLQYHNTSFENIVSYINEDENLEFQFIKNLYKEVFDDMYNFYILNKNNLKLNTYLVHGNLDSSTIICNNFNYKFINFENAFVGNPLFDLSNIIFELQFSGMNEYDFISKRLQDYNLLNNRLMGGDLLKQYKICKYIWTRKRFLDLINDYIKEILVLDKARTYKFSRLCHNFSNHFYRFMQIKSVLNNHEILVQKFKTLFIE